MNKFTKLVSAAALSAALFSCEGTENLDGGNTAISFKGTGSALTLSNARMANTTMISITEAQMGLKAIEMEAEWEVEDDMGNEMEYEKEYEFEGAYTLDLVAGTASPELPLSMVEPGLYNEVEVEIDNVLEGEHSVIFKGTYESAEGAVAFEFTSNEEFEFEVESDTGFQIDEATVSNLLVLFDFDIILNGVDMSTATVAEDGVIYINEAMNAELYETITRQLEIAGDVDEDDDNDGEHDDDEEEENEVED
ncbi:hypothetical protein [Algivirga pacifica]|uniref:DUF4382 domain-containing protein n=1 Tax=Algivirga pacifica TaxID=1162670 RepID=A0ABP9DHA7_9BACT